MARREDRQRAAVSSSQPHSFARSSASYCPVPVDHVLHNLIEGPCVMAGSVASPVARKAMSRNRAR